MLSKENILPLFKKIYLINIKTIQTLKNILTLYKKLYILTLKHIHTF